MSKVSDLTTYIIRKLWTIIAIALVVVALLMSFLRYSLPYLENYKERVENYISQEYTVDLTIGALSANWQRTGPSLVLRDVRIQKGAQSPIALDIGEIFVAIEFWPSITHRKLQSSQVLLSRLNIDIDLQQIETSDADFPIISALENVFLEQLSQFSMTESRVVINSAQNSKTIDIEQLSWLNEGNRHQGVGVFALQDFSNSNAKFILDLFGDVSSYSGTLYAEATDLNLSAWFNEFTGLEGQLVASKGNFEVWARINDGKIDRLDGNILPTTFEWNARDITIDNLVAGRFGAQLNNQNWEFSFPNLVLKVDQKPTEINISGRYSANAGLQFQTVDKLELVNALPMLGLFSGGFSDQIALVDLQATLASLKVVVDADGPTLSAKLRNMSWLEDHSLVGLSDLSSDILWHGNKGRFVFTADDTTLSANYLFDRNLTVQMLNIPVFIDLEADEQFSVVAADIVIDNISLFANASYALDSQFLSLIVDIKPFDLDKVPALLPNHLMGADAKAFLTSAITGEGRIKHANLLWHGQVAAYPYASKEGVFQSKVVISDADFLFSDAWPALTDLNIDLLFENQSLQMRSKSSLLDKVSLSNLTAEIPNLTENAMLTINADGKTNSKDLSSLMMQSTLASSLGNLLENSVQIEGDLTTKLSIYVPLNDGASTRAVGEVYLRENQINLPPINLTFEKASGTITFDNQNIAVTGLQAQLFEQSILADLTGKQESDKYQLNATFEGTWEAKQVAQHLSEEFASYFDGRAKWSLDLLLDLMPEDFRYEATMLSDLVGMSAALPAPLGKKSADVDVFTLLASGDKLASSVELVLQDKLRFDGALAHKEKQFNRAHLALGPTEFESRGLGFSISADFERMQFSQWYPLIIAITANVNKNEKNVLGVPQRIFVDTDRFIIGGQEFTDVDVTTKRLDDQWSLDIDADQARGKVTVFDDWFGRGISADIEYIRIPKKNKMLAIEAASSATLPKITIDPKTLPNIEFTCKSCQILGYDFGRIDVEAEPNDDGLKLTQILLDNQQGNISASGQWYKRNQDHFTFIAGDLNSKDFGSFLKELGLDSGIQDSQADMSFALTWKDSPFDAKFENLDGEIDWQLTDGYLTEVSDKGSRIFTLLSLNSLVRKLSLDFRDVFAKGFFYDNMQGSVQITEGKADTRDTKVDGAAGEIEIYGYTDLAQQKLNYNVSFAPNITGNLPVLVYFFTVSPPTALAALALDQMLTSAKVISNINYSVTGTIADPVLIETGRESTEVNLPARREIIPSDTLSPFVPPTPKDLIEIEVKDGQSD